MADRQLNRQRGEGNRTSQQSEQSTDESSGSGEGEPFLAKAFINSNNPNYQCDKLSLVARKKQKILDLVKETLWRVVQFISNPMMVAETSTIAVKVMKRLGVKEMDRSAYWSIYGKYVNLGLRAKRAATCNSVKKEFMSKRPSKSCIHQCSGTCVSVNNLTSHIVEHHNGTLLLLTTTFRFVELMQNREDPDDDEV